MNSIERMRLKTLAKEQIKGNIGILFLILLAVYVLIFAATWVTSAVGGIGGYIIGPALTISIIMVYLNLAKGIKPQFTDSFNGFEIFAKALLLQLITEVFTFLWTLLFIVPGIIKSISYSAAPYIMAENPTISAMDALDESKRIMDGHKMDYFVLTLSFIPWMLLGVLTLGIALIYAVPYMDMTLTNFYLSIKPQTVEEVTPPFTFEQTMQ